jgi:hypothetical protein
MEAGGDLDARVFAVTPAVPRYMTIVVETNGHRTSATYQPLSPTRTLQSLAITANLEQDVDIIMKCILLPCNLEVLTCNVTYALVNDHRNAPCIAFKLVAPAHTGRPATLHH